MTMVRPFAPADLDRIMEIWLAANLQAHCFVPACRGIIWPASLWTVPPAAGASAGSCWTGARRCTLR